MPWRIVDSSSSSSDGESNSSDSEVVEDRDQFIDFHFEIFFWVRPHISVWIDPTKSGPQTDPASAELCGDWGYVFAEIWILGCPLFFLVLYGATGSQRLGWHISLNCSSGVGPWILKLKRKFTYASDCHLPANLPCFGTAQNPTELNQSIQ